MNYKKPKPGKAPTNHGGEMVLVVVLKLDSLNKDRFGTYHKPRGRVTRPQEIHSGSSERHQCIA